MSSGLKVWNKWKFATVTLVLVVALLVSCFAVLYQPSFEAEAKEPVLLNVSIDGKTKIGANDPTPYTARVFGGEGALTYTWSIEPDDSNVQLEPDGSVCVLTFTTATEAPYTLEVKVYDEEGNFGVASMAVYDPPTYPATYIGTGANAPYSYLIKADGTGWYYAVDGSTGAVSWSSNNASTVIQNTITATNSGNIRLKDGAYLIDANIMFYAKHNIVFEGESWNTILYTQTNNYILRISLGSSDITVRNLCINGSGNPAHTGQTGIGIANSWNIFIDKCKIQNNGYDASHLLTNTTNVHFTENEVCYNNDDALNAGGLGYDDVTGTIFDMNYIHHNTNDGIHLSDGSENSTVTKNIITDNTNGIGIYNSSFNIITDNTVQRNDYGIKTLFGVCASQTVTENRITDNTYNGIDLQHNSWFSTVSKNTIDGADRGIYIIAYNDTITDNIIRNIVNYGLVVSGGGSYFHIIDGNRVDNAPNGFLINAKNCTISNSFALSVINYGFAEDASNSDSNIFLGCVTDKTIITYGANTEVHNCRDSTGYIA